MISTSWYRRCLRMNSAPLRSVPTSLSQRIICGNCGQLAGRAQEDVSAGNGFKQTSVSRLEKHADMKLSTLLDYVEYLEGTLELAAKLRCAVRSDARWLGQGIAFFLKTCENGWNSLCF